MFQRRSRLALVVGLTLVATSAPALAEPEGPPLLPLEAADDGLEGDYNRVGDFKMPTSAVSDFQDVAIRVTLKRMYIDREEDPANGCPVRQDLPDLQAFEGQVRYLGPPEVFDNNASSAPKWVGAKLQCTPFYRDWSASALAAELGISEAEADTIYYYGAEVVPCSIHDVQQATQSCVDSGSEDCFSDPLEIRTALFGDVWSPFSNYVDLSDIGNEVNAFKSIPLALGGIGNWRSMLRDNQGAPETDINFMDIARVVDGFKSHAYPERGPVDCPGGLAVFGLGAPAQGAMASLKAVEVNGVSLPSSTNTVTVAPGDTILAQVFISGWGDEIDNVRIWQWGVLGEAGSTSGISGTILPLGFPDSPDDGAFIDAGLACTGGPNVGEPCVSSERDCDGPDLCDCIDLDFIMCEVPSAPLCAVANVTLDYRYGCIVFDDVGAIDDGRDFYVGSLILEVSKDACGTFTFAMDTEPDNNFLTSSTPEQTIHPLTEDLVIEVECDPTITCNPPNCSIDARYPNEPNDINASLNWDELDITFAPIPDAGIDSVGCGSFSFRIVGGTVFEVSCTSVTTLDDDTVHVQLSRKILNGRWMCIKYNPGQPGANECCLMPLPADVNASRIPNGTDLLDLIDFFNGEGDPLAMWQCDIDRDGQCLLSDLTAEIDLLLGVGAFRPWLDFPCRVACPTAP
ncbi:MAG: hypothetical protein IID38_11730 [Planctomycetes bacterium]|nr:hypothetical protein [Planctomycetota bacterium]